MKVDRQRLTQAMNIASLVMEKRNTIPILSHMAIMPMVHSVMLIGTDLDMEVRAQIEVDDSTGLEPITIAAPARIARVLNLGGTQVEIGKATVDKEKTAIAFRSGRLDLQVTHLPYGNFPRIQTPENPGNQIELSLDHIDAMLRASRACSTEESRYYLNGLYLHTVDEPSTVSTHSLRAVSTDGHRLYVAPIAAPRADVLAKILPMASASGTGERGMIIPRKAINLLARLRPKIEGGVTMGISPRLQENSDKTLIPQAAGTIVSFAFTMRDSGIQVKIATKIIDGTFPDYHRVIPTAEQDKRVLVGRKDLAQAVRLISAAGSGKTKAIRLTFDPTGPKLGVAATGIEDILSASTWIPAETSVKEPFTIGFNGRYLADLCDVTEGDTLLIETMDSGSPTRITSPEGEGFRTVLMPMRV